MALGVTVVLGVDDDAALAHLLVGMVLGMAHLPVEEIVVFFPLLLGETPFLQHVARTQTQDRCQFAVFHGDPGKELEEEGGISLFILVPGITLELFLRDLVLDDPVIVEFYEVALELAVVAPDAVVIGHVHSDHAGLDLGQSPRTIGEVLEEGTAEIQSAAGIHARFGNAVFGRNGRDFDHGVAANGTARAAVSPHRVLPGNIAQVVDGIGGPVGDPIEVVGIAGPGVDDRVRGPPFAALGGDPACRRRVFRPGLGRIGDDMLVVGSEEGKVVLDQLLPLLLLSRQSARCLCP